MRLEWHFKQLYYTSCEHGLGGYAGYQFNAITPGVSAAVLREVEERTVYQPPRWLTGPDAGSWRLNRPHSPIGSARQPARRSPPASCSPAQIIQAAGNYFVHASPSSTPEHDLGALLPAELWGAPSGKAPRSATPNCRNWRRRCSRVVDRPRAQAFLSAHGAQECWRSYSARSAGRWPESGRS